VTPLTDTPELPFLPPELHLGDDDVVESVEVIVDAVDDDDPDLVTAGFSLPGDDGVIATRWRPKTACRASTASAPVESRESGRWPCCTKPSRRGSASRPT
jgi:hypothetical protein